MFIFFLIFLFLLNIIINYYKFLKNKRMFACKNEKNDKNLVNSILSMEELFNDKEIDKNNSKKSNNKNSTSKIANSDSKINDNDEFFGFENIESPKEVDFGDFRVIEQFSGKNNLKNLNKKSDNYKIDLLNLIVINKIYKSKKKNQSFKSYITSIYYNKNSTKHKFNMETFKTPCYIYDSTLKEILGDIDINYSFNFFLYMSYRSGFETLKNVGCGSYTSDCGWGCMLRCCQMMLSRGIIKRDLFDLFGDKKKVISKSDILNLKKDVLCLFNDRFMSFKELKKNKFLGNIYEKYKEKEDEYELIPPYSIYTLCKLSKCSGVFTSDMKIIRCFKEINEQLFKDDYRIANFENGIIQKKNLLETFCIKKELFKDEGKNVIINSLTNIEQNCINNIDEKNPLNAINIFDYFGEEYIFTKGGFVFISLRLGLRNLDEYYFNIIPLIFQKFHNNIGFVSGKKNRAFYFIGINGDNKLIYADPHLNQKVEDDDITSYEIKDLYLLDIKELSSEITFGININNSTDFKILIYELQWFNKNYPNIISFK